MKIIADEEFLDRTEAGNFIGMATSTFDKLLAKAVTASWSIRWKFTSRVDAALRCGLASPG